MSNAVSRVVVGLIGLPIVLGVVYIGGWWVFALAAIAAGIALHEYWLLARPLAPLAPAGYIGAALCAGRCRDGRRRLDGSAVC